MMSTCDHIGYFLMTGSVDCARSPRMEGDKSLCKSQDLASLSLLGTGTPLTEATI